MREYIYIYIYICIGFIDLMFKGKSSKVFLILFLQNNFKGNDKVIFNLILKLKLISKCFKQLLM